jgi:CubicO group peptidase (beta-lactamase class C family)
MKKFPNPYNLHGPILIDYPKTEGTYFSGGAGLSSTIYDYAIFMQMMLNGGIYDGKRILSRNAVRLMTMSQTEAINGTFGLGFDVVGKKQSAFTPENENSFTWGGIFSTTYWADPKEKIVALIYKQVWNDTAPDATEKFKVLVYGALED